MGFFDFLKKKNKEPNLLQSDGGREPRKGRGGQRKRSASNRESRDQRRRERRLEKLKQRAGRKEEQRRVSYERIHFWVESRIGIMADMNNEEIESRLHRLLAEERQKNTAPRLFGKGNYDPYAGLEAYIRTNSYRRMLDGSAQATDVLLDYLGTEGVGEGSGMGMDGRQTKDGSGTVDGGGQMPQSLPGASDQDTWRKLSNPRYQALINKHPSYGRLHYWIEQRIGPMSHLSDDEIHRKLLQFLADERERNPPRSTQKGGTFDPCSGLEAYIRSRAYIRMLEH